ncbi:MAG: XRE family transcriptional regulator [Acidiferrobacteraceae bacterium]
MKTVVDLGAELAARREALGRTQSDLGAETALRQEVLSRLERGRLSDVSVSKLLRVAHALGLELALVPLNRERPTLETLLTERKQGANTGPTAR